jgi:hypothetical protein
MSVYSFELPADRHRAFKAKLALEGKISMAQFLRDAIDRELGIEKEQTE